MKRAVGPWEVKLRIGVWRSNGGLIWIEMGKGRFKIAGVNVVAAISFILLVVAVFLALIGFFFVHRAVDYGCLFQARRFCRKNGFKLTKWRCAPAFDKSGVKTK